MTLQARALTNDEQQHLSQSRTEAVRDVEQARIILSSSQGQRVPVIVRRFDATPSLTEVSVTAIASFLYGSVVDPKGFAEEVARTSSLAAMPA